MNISITKKLKRSLLIAAIISGSLTVFSSCGKTGNTASDSNLSDGNKSENAGSNTVSDEDSVDESNNNESSSDEVTKLVIATGGTGPIPYLYVDENGNLTGSEIETIKEVFNRLPQYEIEFQITEFASIFTGLDAGLYDMGLNHLAYNPERLSKYTFSDCYGIDAMAIVVRDDNEDIRGVNDFVGHSTEYSATTAIISSFEKWNDTHPDAQIDLKYKADESNTIVNVSDGLFDFYFFDKATIETQIEEFNLQNLKVIDVPMDEFKDWYDGVLGQFLFFQKDVDPRLVADFNTALREAIDDGTIHEIRNQFLGLGEDDLLTIDYLDFAVDKIEELKNREH